MAKEYKYGDLNRSDRLMEEYTKQGHRPPSVMKLARSMEQASKNINDAIRQLADIREKIKPLCTHAVEDMIYREVTFTDTIGSASYTSRYLTCKLCGEELYRKEE